MYMPAKRNLVSLLNDKALVKEMRLKAESDKPFPRAEQWSIKADIKF
jgi:hypothetical protein